MEQLNLTQLVNRIAATLPAFSKDRKVLVLIDPEVPERDQRRIRRSLQRRHNITPQFVVKLTQTSHVPLPVRQLSAHRQEVATL